jgi:hypothetical protein
MRRHLLLDSLAFCFVMLGGVGLYIISSLPIPSANLVSEFENLIWIAFVCGVAMFRAKIGDSRYQCWLFELFEWCFVALTANLALFCLDAIIHPAGGIKTTVGFNLFVFVVPSVVVSAIVYALFCRIALDQRK